MKGEATPRNVLSLPQSKCNLGAWMGVGGPVCPLCNSHSKATMGGGEGWKEQGRDLDTEQTAQ
jgi:hypothetical protein